MCRQCTQGWRLGYGSIPVPHKWTEGGMLLTLGLGYGDGVTNHYQGLSLTFEGREGVVMGRVSMDMIQVLFSHGNPCKEGGRGSPLDGF